ncbi:MAG: 16S rRNA (guanine(527)-N(7))-methyltransferase RsmG [Clostridiales bacterium]|nr:16S rRNA (guanine(527)-N(7))-methyltransferase RsmG [Clostridiales bacterium]
MEKYPDNISGKQTFCSFLRKNFTDDGLITKFEALTKLYFEVNSIINISALRTEDDVYIKHYLDSIYPYKYFNGRCCDVGCGGGFPCLPLAIVTDLEFVGLDSVGKKLTLINRCTKELKLKNISAVHARAEDLAKHGKSFDTVCARAVSDVDKSLSFCAPLAKQGGKIVLYKTQNDCKAKNSTENKLNVRLIQTEDYTLPNTDIKRRVFIYEKL